MSSSRAAPSGGVRGGGDRAAQSVAASQASARSRSASSHSEFSVILHTLEQWSGVSQLQWTCCNPQSSQRTLDNSSAGLERGAQRHAEDGPRRAETRGRVLPQRNTHLAEPYEPSAGSVDDDGTYETAVSSFDDEEESSDSEWSSEKSEYLEKDYQGIKAYRRVDKLDRHKWQLYDEARLMEQYFRMDLRKQKLQQRLTVLAGKLQKVQEAGDLLSELEKADCLSEARIIRLELAQIEAKKKRTARSGIRKVTSKVKDEDAKLEARSEEVHARRPARAEEKGEEDDGSAGAPLNEVWASGRRESRDAKIDQEIAEARRQMMALGFSKHEVQSAIRSYNLKK